MANSITATGDKNGGDNVDIATEIEVNVLSPASASSGDTLHDDDSSDIRSDGSTVNTFSSPVSPDSISLDSLSIKDSASRLPKGGIGRYVTPFQRGVKGPNDGTRFSFTPGDYSWREGNVRTGSPFSGGRGAGAGHRSSRTWMSQDTQAMQEFMVIRNAMRRQFRNADVSKWRYTDYIAHREAMLASEANRLANKVKEKEHALHRAHSIPIETQQSLNKWGILGNFDQKGNLGRVLGEETIWCEDWLDGKDEIAPWPSLAEMKWEGDDRAKTGVGRFLALPREEGPPGLAWNQLPCVEQYPMDQVARIPTMEDVYLPVDDQIEEDHEYLWSKKLEKSMDDFLEL